MYFCENLEKMGKKFFILLMSVLMCGASASALGLGEKRLGPRLGYSSENESVYAGLAFCYSVSPHLRLAPEVGCVFRNNDKDAFTFDFNVHAPFGLLPGTSMVELYPFVGLTYNSWGSHWDDIDIGKDVSTHTNRFGANVGAGFGLRCTPTMLVNFEAKYTLIKSYSSAYLSVGINYIF